VPAIVKLKPVNGRGAAAAFYWLRLCSVSPLLVNCMQYMHTEMPAPSHTLTSIVLPGNSVGSGFIIYSSSHCRCSAVTMFSSILRFAISYLSGSVGAVLSAHAVTSLLILLSCSALRCRCVIRVAISSSTWQVCDVRRYNRCGGEMRAYDFV
jgi:hypothetical protein